MNNDTNDTTDTKKTTKTHKGSSFMARSKPFILMLLLLLVLAIIASYIFAVMGSRLNNTNTQFLKINNNLKALQSEQETLSQTVATLSAQTHINQAYMLAEVEHLLIIASHKLELAHNISGALASIEAAHKRLSGLDDPQIKMIREQLLADIETLQSVNPLDLQGPALFLSDFIDQIDQLPLKTPKKASHTEQSTNDDDTLFSSAWNELKSLVIIERKQTHDRDFLSSALSIKSTIKLELAYARSAIFNRDTQNLHVSIKRIRTWLNDYFDLSNPAIRNIDDSLSHMQKMELSPPQINIYSSLESVRALIRNQNTTTVQ